MVGTFLKKNNFTDEKALAEFYHSAAEEHQIFIKRFHSDILVRLKFAKITCTIKKSE